MLIGRQALPYPPGRIRINGDIEPAIVSGDITLAWAHRDRTQQTAYLVQQDEGDIGPELGVSYTVRIRNRVGSAVHTETSLIGTTFIWSTTVAAAEAGALGDRITVEISAERDGLGSWQPQVSVKHGTRERDASKKLLWSDVNGQGLGTLIPDAILYVRNDVQGVADAKYKSLHPSANAPNGPQRDDLYQMAAYLGRFAPLDGKAAWGLLAYPDDPSRPTVAPAEQYSPWSLDHGKKVVFTSLPHDAARATEKLRDLISQMTSERSALRAQA